MRLADYRDKTREAEEARNALAVMTASIERSRGLYGYDVKPAPFFRSGRKAYEAETARMAGKLGLLGKIGTAQAALGEAGLAKEGTIGGYREYAKGAIGAARERKLGTLGAAKLGAEADIFGYETGEKTAREETRRAWGVEERRDEKARREGMAAMFARGATIDEVIRVYGGQAPGGAEGGLPLTDEELTAEITAMRAPEREAEEVEAVSRYFPVSRTPSALEVRQRAAGRLSAVQEKIRRAREYRESY